MHEILSNYVWAWGAGGENADEKTATFKKSFHLCLKSVSILWEAGLLALLGWGRGPQSSMFVPFCLMGCCVTVREVTASGTPAENRDFKLAAQRELGKNTYICSIELGLWLRGWQLTLAVSDAAVKPLPKQRQGKLPCLTRRRSSQGEWTHPSGPQRAERGK